MERLQIAIEKAKAKREQQAKDAPVEDAPETPEGDTEGVAEPNSISPGAKQEVWDALTSFHPKPRILQRNRIVAAENSSAAAPYDMLRTRILQQVRKNGWKRILITSPGSNCGKTTVTANLALSFGRNPELHTLAFDMDLRRPKLGKLFGTRQSESLHQVLDGRARFEEHAVRIGNNVAITSNQTAARHSSELLQSDRTADLLDTVEALYQPDVMLFDMPPLNGSDDTHAFLPQVDCAVLIAAAEATTIEEIDASERDLSSQLPVVGVVLNKCRYIEKGYGYDY